MVRIQMSALLIALLFSLALAAEEQPLLRHNSLSSCARKPCYNQTISDLTVQKALLELAAGPTTNTKAQFRRSPRESFRERDDPA